MRHCSLTTLTLRCTRKLMEDKRQETDSHECENDMPALRVGYYDWNLDTNAMCWSAEFYEILGLTGQNIVPNYQRFIARSIPKIAYTLTTSYFLPTIWVM